MVTSPPSDVFISYNRRDTASAEHVARALTERGLSVFFDRWSLPPGEAWAPLLEAALARCRAVLVIVGPGGMSDWQRSESDLALDRQRRGDEIRVVPVIVAGGDPPLGFLRLNTWVDLRDGADAAPLLDLLAAIARGEATGTTPSLCPYRGLRPFRPEDAPFFFGRDTFVGQAVAAVSSRSVTVVAGASGAGKSSAIRAGLLPRLASDARESWLPLVMRPGREPFHALAANLDALIDRGAADAERLVRTRELGSALAAGRLTVRDAIDDVLARSTDRPRVLLFIDQWEELYTQCADDAVRQRFINAVLDAAEGGAVRLLFTVRGDFFDDVLATRRLADALQGGILSLGPMSQDELRACIEGPAGRVGLSFEAGLVERLLEDADGGAGSLPLLAFVLAQLWEHRRGSVLIHQAYDALGGLQGALAQRAEAEFAKLSAADQEAARSVMLELVQIAPGSADAGRRATREEVGEQAWRVVMQLADARLLVTSLDDATDVETVEVAHEAMIRNWDRLKSWLDEDREFLLWRQRLHHAIDEYERPDTGGAAALLRGSLLDEARRWVSAKPGRLADRDLHFIAQSARRARNLRVRRAVNALGVFAVIVGLGIASYAWLRAQGANRRARQARILEAAAGAADPAIAALLIAELDAQREPRSGASVARRVADRAIPIAVLDRGVASPVTAAAITPDGARVLAGYEDGVMMLWPADGAGDGALAATAPAMIRDVAFDPTGALWLALTDAGEPRLGRTDGAGEMRPWGDAPPADVMYAAFAGPDTIVTVSDDGAIRAWPIAAGARARPVGTAAGPVIAAKLSNDGSRIAIATGNVVRIWPLDGASPIVLEGHRDRVTAIAFDGPAMRAVTGSWDGTARVWNLADGSGREVRASAAAIWSVGFDESGRYAVTAGRDGETCITDLAGALPAPSCHRGDGAVRDAAFLPGGEIAIAGATMATLWSPLSHGDVSELRGHTGAVNTVRFSRDGARLITGSLDGTLRVWHGGAPGDPLLFDAPHRPASPFWAGALDPSGRLAGIAAESGVAWIWRQEDGTAQPLEGHERGVATIAFDASGEHAVTGSWDGRAIVWALATGKPIAVLGDGRGPVLAARFSPAGDAVLTGADDGTVRLARGPDFADVVELFRHTGLVRDVAFFPDGAAIATASSDSTAALVRIDRRGEAMVLRHGGAVRSVDVSADGTRLVTASDDGAAIVWDAAGDTTIALRHDGAVLTARFDERGMRVVTASADETARVWELARGGEQTVLRGHHRELRGARFSHDGRLVVTYSNDSTALLHQLDGAAEPVRLTHGGVVREALFLTGDERILTVSEDGSARVWRIGWRALHQHLAAATSACLAPALRERALDEPPATARARFERCERAHGRAPPVEES